MRLLYATAITAVNVAVVWFWCRRGRRIVEDAEREAQRIEDSARRSARRTAAIAAAQEQARRECSDGLPPGVYACVNEPFVGNEALYVEEWTPLEDFACRKLDADGERRIVGFLVGDCRHKIDHDGCPRIERLRELHARRCRLHHHPEEPATPRGDADAGDGDGVAADVRDEDGHHVAAGPVPHEDARAPGEAVAPEVPEAEGEAADGGGRDAPVAEERRDRAEDGMHRVHAPSVAPAPEGRKAAKMTSPALAHCDYRVEEDAPGGPFRMTLTTPFEGATVAAGMGPADESGRAWSYAAGVLNCRGTGWTVSGVFRDCGRYVAKSLLRTLALELRKAYCHRGQKIRKRAIARAIARREAEEAGHA